MQIVVRLLVIAFGFLLAGMAAGAVVTLAILYPAWSDFATGAFEEGTARIVMTVGLVFVSGYALLPALVLIAIAEAFAIRTVLYYAMAGALVGAILFLSFGGIDPAMLTIDSFARRETEIMVGAGIVAGLVYWLVAGRRAGAGFIAARETPHAGAADGRRA